MQARLHAESPRGRRKLVVAGKIGAHYRGMRLARMQIDRHVQGLRALENAPEPLFVEEASSGQAIDDCTFAAEPRDGTFKLAHGSGRIGCRQRGQCGKAPWMRAHRLDEE